MARYDVGGVIHSFLARRFAERRGLIKEMTEAVMHEPMVKRLLAEIGDAAVDRRLGPIEVLGLGLMYGMVIGILLEKVRRQGDGHG